MQPRLEHQTLRVGRLIEDFLSGQIVIPEFQRGYVWKPSKAAKLLDSLYNGFPIASLLLWQSDENVRSIPQPLQKQLSKSINFLIDGQQRLSTLARIKNGKEDGGLDVVFNADTEEFRLSSASTNTDKAWFRVAEIWDGERYRHIRRELDEDSRGRSREARIERVYRIQDYEVPYVKMIDHTFKNAVSAFERINTLGMRLKKEDIESAQIAAIHTGFIVDEVIPFLRRIRERGYSRMNIMHLFRVCEFIAKPDGRNRTPLHEMDKKAVEIAWKKTQKATEAAINLIASQLGLTNMDILWSGAIIVPVIAMCATLGPRDLNARGIAGWIALAALVRRYSVAAETALDQDLRACRSSDPLAALLASLRQVRPLSARPEDFGGTLADRSGLLTMYIACYHEGLLDFYSGGRIAPQSNIDRHHILPRAQFSEKERSVSDCIANLAFIEGRSNKSIGLTGPEVYLPKVEKAILKSQCIPDSKELWRIDRANLFWAARRQLLVDAFNDFVRESLPNRKL